MEEVGYWVAKIESEVVLQPFIDAYGYGHNIEKLKRWYRDESSPYKNFVFPINVEPDRSEPGINQGERGATETVR